LGNVGWVITTSYNWYEGAVLFHHTVDKAMTERNPLSQHVYVEDKENAATAENGPHATPFVWESPSRNESIFPPIVEVWK
jgi:hypothetical protein